MNATKLIDALPLIEGFVKLMRKADRTGDNGYRSLASAYRKRALHILSESEFAKLVGIYMRLSGENVTVGAMLREYRKGIKRASNVADIEDAVADLFKNRPYVKEFTGGTYSGRIDMLVVQEDNTLVAVEIKSDRDSLSRIVRQIVESKLTFDYTYAAIDVKHYERFMRDYSGLGSGLIVYDDGNAEIITEPLRNERACYFDFLWKSELAKMASPYVKNASRMRVPELRRVILENMPFASMCNEARAMFVGRLIKKSREGAK